MTEDSKNPQCPMCGQRLTKSTDAQKLTRKPGTGWLGSEARLANTRQPHDHTIAWVATVTADNRPPEYGPFGDNLVCSLACGRALAIHLVRSIGPDALNFLPERLRADRRPPPKKGHHTEVRALMLIDPDLWPVDS